MEPSAMMGRGMGALSAPTAQQGVLCRRMERIRGEIGSLRTGRGRRLFVGGRGLGGGKTHLGQHPHGSWKSGAMTGPDAAPQKTNRSKQRVAR